MLTKMQIAAMSHDEQMRLLHNFQEATGCALRVFTRGDADAIANGYEEEALTDDEWRSLANSCALDDLASWTDPEWEDATSTVLDFIRKARCSKVSP